MTANLSYKYWEKSDNAPGSVSASGKCAIGNNGNEICSDPVKYTVVTRDEANRSSCFKHLVIYLNALADIDQEETRLRSAI